MEIINFNDPKAEIDGWLEACRLMREIVGGRELAVQIAKQERGHIWAIQAIQHGTIDPERRAFLKHYLKCITEQPQ